MKKYPFFAAIIGISVLSTAAYANFDKAVATLDSHLGQLHDKNGAGDQAAPVDKKQHSTGSSSQAQAGQTQAGQTASAQPGKAPANTEEAAVPAQPKLKEQAQVNVPAQAQLPELFNGCEMTSLAMMLQAAGKPVDKLTLAAQIKKDPTPLVVGDDGDPLSWGDPNRGFVGDISGDDMGYAVYHGPVAQLVNQLLPNGAVDLTGKGFDQVLAAVADGRPAVVWTTAHFNPPVEWTTWKGPNGQVKATFEEHAVLLVGYDANNVYINDPFDGTKAKAISRKTFESGWKAMGSQAVTFNK